jgi:hypothetical protein
MKWWWTIIVLLLATVALIACAVPIDDDCSFNHLKYDAPCRK